MKNIKYLYILSILFCSLFMFSCEEEETISEVKVDRLFRPAELAAYTSGINVTLAWTPIKNATYLLEISKDSLLFENELQPFDVGEGTMTDNNITYKIEDYFWSNTRYSARVKSISADPTVDDSGWQEVTFVTGSEDTFYSTPDDNIGADWVLLNWIPGKNVDKMVVSTTGASDVTISLTAGEIAVGEKLFENLNIGTTYKFTIYLGERPRGQVTITTDIYWVTVDQTKNAGVWNELGTYNFISDAGAYVIISNKGTSGNVFADAVKFSRNGTDIIVDNADSNVEKTGTWSTSTSSSARWGANYFHDGNANKGSSTFKFLPDLPESGEWTVYMMNPAGGGYASSIPVGIYTGVE